MEDRFTVQTPAVNSIVNDPNGVSLLIPFVVAYIAVAWRAMDRHKITKDELDQTKHKY